MGTRADFYVENDGKLEWLGSTAWDGYPDGFKDELMNASNEADFRAALEREFSGRDDVTRPERGWPWPWNNSETTDYGYVFRNGCVMFERDGHWIKVADHGAYSEECDENEQAARAKYSQGEAEFPDMTDRKNVTLGRRSGLIVLGS